MPILPIEQLDFGGVDSRSNPLNIPPNRMLRCLNWVPKQAGFIEQRWGYSTVSMSTVSVNVFQTLIPYRLWTGTKYLLLFQGTTWTLFNIATGAVTSPTIRGAAVGSSAAGGGYFFNNRLHFGNGSDQKFFDGTTWRDNGIRVPTSGEGSAVTVSAGTNDANALPVAILSGYQFYMAYYNATTGHVGNRISIGARLANTASTVDVSFTGLPQMSTVGGNNSAGDSEWKIVLGRTGDGAQVPYVVVDTGNNWVTVPNTATTFTLTFGGIDGNFELPTRNGVIPSAQLMFAVVSDYIYSAAFNSPTVNISGSAIDSRNGQFMGRPEQSWAGDDIESFPTADAITCLAEVDGECFVATLNDCAILTDLAGVRTWRGPWPVGCAGARAFCKTHHGFFWLSNDKELCTFVNGVPTAISEEYEAAELSGFQLNETNLYLVEMQYFRDKGNGKDEIRITCNRNGVFTTVIHDFKLMDQRSPYGQGYSAQYQGPLGTTFTSAVVRDSNSKLQVWSGAQAGQLYQHYTGADDAGTQFTSDGIALINCSPDRPSVPFVDWYGDQNVVVSIGKTLSTDLGSDQFQFEQLTNPDDLAEAVQGYENDFRYRAKLPSPELHHTYFRFQLTSHSADGSLALNTPPHVPLENYGRIYEFIPSIGDKRGV